MGKFLASSHDTRQVLVGRIVTMDAQGTVYPRGAVCIEADRIAAVVADPAHVPEPFAGMMAIETGGTLYPGLIELHNHLSYNFLPLWTVPRSYTNRNQWREHEPDYPISISLPAKVIGANADIDYPRSIARFVECRSLLGGTTTTQGLSTSSSGGKKWYQGLTRNVEAPNDAAFSAAGTQTLDYTPPEIATKLVPALQKDRPFFYHLSEGTDPDARQRFLDLEYLPNTWAIDTDLIPIHCTALQGGDYQRLKAAAGMVWSPLSNLLLYGQTADVAAAKTAGLLIALGSDWSPSGSKNLLGELKVARIVSEHHGGLFTTQELVRMVTSAPARMLGWHGQVGTVTRGLKADLLILEGSSADPYDQLVNARESDILAVTIDGRPRHGRLGFLDFDAKRQERVVIGGKDFSLDLTESGDDPLAGLSLGTAIAKLTYGLAHLPELAGSAPGAALLAFKAIEREAITIDFELEAKDDFATLQDVLRASASALKPMPMAPITATDDPDFITALKANVNLPDYVKQAL
ncbi:amidohydrolase family protein [Mesorhizobium sp. M0244]|uniref:amidohydrolase family protein n=1 Tax=Mesorhizobium sp. M0244 TaxID=2956926 RepID=UPI00333A9CAA